MQFVFNIGADNKNVYKLTLIIIVDWPLLQRQECLCLEAAGVSFAILLKILSFRVNVEQTFCPSYHFSYSDKIHFSDSSKEDCKLRNVYKVASFQLHKTTT